MNKAIGYRVKLQLMDSDAGIRKSPPSGWRLTTGRLVASVMGTFNKVWYLMELNEPLPPGYFSLDVGYSERLEKESTRYLLLSAHPPLMTTDEVPPDYIGEVLPKREKIPVGITLGIPPKKLPQAITIQDIQSGLFPGLCSGTLEAM